MDVRRIRERYTWLKRVGPLWKTLDAFDTVLGLWERIPGFAKNVTSAFILSLFLGSPLALLLRSLEVIGDNWIWFVLVALLIGSVFWFVIAGALSLRPSQVPPEQPRGRVEVTEPVYVPEDHAKPSGVLAGSRSQGSLRAISKSGAQKCLGLCRNVRTR